MKENNSKIFVNNLPGKACGRKSEEVREQWKVIKYEGLNKLFPSSSIISVINLRILKWVWHVARTGGLSNSYNILVGKPERKAAYKT
jgi:hypothetical protein